MPDVCGGQAWLGRLVGFVLGVGTALLVAGLYLELDFWTLHTSRRMDSEVGQRQLSLREHSAG